MSYVLFGCLIVIVLYIGYAIGVFISEMFRLSDSLSILNEDEEGKEDGLNDLK